MTTRTAMWTLAAALLVAAPAMAAPPADFTGIYTLAPNERQQAAQQDLPPAAFTNPNVDGIFIRVSWSQIEPQSATYDWTTLDAYVRPALQGRKKLSVAVVAGESTPGWLYASGVPAHMMTVHSGEKARCFDVTIPTPWHPTFIAAHIRMMGALAQHLRSIPGAYDAVRIVKITGVNLRTAETKLPFDDNNQLGTCTTTDAIAMWQQAGYRPSLVINAWTAMARGTSIAFPDKLLVVQGLGSKTAGFPPIGENGARVRSVDAVHVGDALVSSGLALFSGRFGVQWDGLSPTRISQNVLDAGKRGAIIGWQSNASGGGGMTAGCDAAPCTVNSYVKLVQEGVRNRARYLELWYPDIEAFPRAVAEGQVALRGRH